MKIAVTRETALETLGKHNREPFHVLHALTVEGVTRWFAQDQGYGEGENPWGIVSLPHNIDFEMYPEQYCVEVPEFLKGAGVEDELIRVACSHGYGLVAGVKPKHRAEKILFVSDELTSLIGTAARIRLSGGIMDTGVPDLKREFKDKRFTAGCSRGVIREGAEGLGWILGEPMNKIIRATRSCGAAVGEEMKAYEAQHLPHYHLYLL